MRPLSFAFLFGGIALIVFGVSATESISGSLVRFSTDASSAQAIYFLLAGIVATLSGLGGLHYASRR